MRVWTTAIITGGGSGIGRALAQRLLQDGVDVAIIDRTCAAETRQTLESVGPGRVHFFKGDVTDDKGVQEVVSMALETMGSIDLVVNCAGVQVAKPFRELSSEEFEWVVRVNLCGSRNVAAAVLPRMTRGSQLVLIASLAGLVSNHSYAAYNASKYGVVGLAGALRLECITDGIDVCVVCPPEVNTPMVVEEHKSLPPVAARLKSSAGTLELDTACDSIMRQLRKRHFLIIPGWRARGVALLERFFPGLMRSATKRIVLSMPVAKAPSSP